MSNETILRHLIRNTSEESERQKTIGSSRQNTTSAHSVQSDLHSIQESRKPDRPVTIAKTDPIKELTNKVIELTGLVEAMLQQTFSRPLDPAIVYPQSRSKNRKDRTFGCPNCVEQNSLFRLWGRGPQGHWLFKETTRSGKCEPETRTLGTGGTKGPSLEAPHDHSREVRAQPLLNNSKQDSRLLGAPEVANHQQGEPCTSANVMSQLKHCWILVPKLTS